MLKTRIITALIGIPLLLGLLYWGEISWIIVFTLMGMIALYEYLNMMKAAGLTPLVLTSYGLLGVLMFREQLAALGLPLMFATIFLMIALCVLMYPRSKFDDLALGFFGAFYIGFMLSFALAMLSFSQPFIVMVLTFVLTWSADIGGYLFGRLWGHSQLTPYLSPNKTWAGSIGGLALTVIMALLFCLGWPKLPLNINQIIGLGLMAGIAAQFGDLFASAMKRYFRVKDSGFIIPGHGGVLDRFDSFLLVLPVVYYWVTFLG